MISATIKPATKGVITRTQDVARNNTAQLHRILTWAYAIAMNKINAWGEGCLVLSTSQAVATASTETVTTSKNQKTTGDRCGM